MTIRRRLLYLMHCERWLAYRIADRRAAGLPAHFFAAECSAVHWAISELAQMYPAEAELARADFAREVQRRAIIDAQILAVRERIEGP